MENISQGTDEDLAIQASIQASLKELVGEPPPPEDSAETASAPEAALEPATAPTVEAASLPIEEEAPPAEVAETIEVPVDNALENTAESAIAFEETAEGEENQELSEDLTQDVVFDSTEDSGDDVTGDILFEEVLDIDAIQQKLLERIYEDDPEIATSQDVDTVIDKQAAVIEEKKARLPVRANSITSRKYVVYVDSENIDFMENLTIEERKEIINKILKDQNELSIQTKEFRKKKKILNHALIACMTFIIGFPIMFIMVNKSIEASMTNYQEAKQNVARLYKQGGKVKMEGAGKF